MNANTERSEKKVYLKRSTGSNKGGDNSRVQRIMVDINRRLDWQLVTLNSDGKDTIERNRRRNGQPKSLGSANKCEIRNNKGSKFYTKIKQSQNWPSSIQRITVQSFQQ